MIELSEQTWAFKVYSLAVRIWSAFLNRPRDNRRTNVCQFIRTIFVWLPLTILIQLVFYAWAIYVVIVWPILTFGSGYLEFWAIVGGAAAAVLLIVGLVKGINKLDRLLEALCGKAAQTKSAREVATIWSLIRQRAHDAHERICTPLRFRKSDHA